MTRQFAWLLRPEESVVHVSGSVIPAKNVLGNKCKATFKCDLMRIIFTRIGKYPVSYHKMLFAAKIVGKTKSSISASLNRFQGIIFRDTDG